MTEQLTIARLGHRGDGIADTPVGPVYVPYTLPGETVTVEPVAGHPDRRHLDHVDRPSHERTAPICKHFTQCGGCAMQHWSLAEYHLWKRGLVAEALAQAGIIAPVADIIDAHGQGRRRARAACAARRARRAGSRLHRAAGASHYRHRPLPHSGAGPRRRNSRGLGDRRDLEAGGQAARHPGDRDRFRHGRRRARLRPAQFAGAPRSLPASPRNTDSRASPGTANWWRRPRSRS